MKRGRPDSAPRAARGFSLVEILVAASLFAIMTIAIMSVYRVGLNTEATTAQRTKLQDGLQYGIKALDKEIGEASASVSTSTSESVTVLIPIYDTSGVPTGFTDAVTFAASGSELYQTVVPGVASTRSAFVKKRLLTNLPTPYPSPGLFSYWKRVDGSLTSTTPDDATIVRATLFQTDVYAGREQTVQLFQDIRMRNR